MILLVLAALAVGAALWSRTCFENARLTAGKGHACWRYHGVFYAGVAAGLVGLGLLSRWPGAGLVGLAAFAALALWALKLKLDVGRGRY